MNINNKIKNKNKSNKKKKKKYFLKNSEQSSYHESFSFDEYPSSVAPPVTYAQTSSSVSYLGTCEACSYQTIDPANDPQLPGDE